MLHPVDQWPAGKSRDELIGEMSEQLESQVPGVAFGFTQPIEMRVDELVAGVKADVAVLLYGDDLEVLAAKGKEIERVLRGIAGAVDVKADYQANVPTLSIRPLPEQLSRYGVNASDVLDVVNALGGYPVGHVFEGRARFPILVRFPEQWRANVEFLQQIPVDIVGGQPITLGSVADIELEETPPGIEHESGRRRTFIQANVRHRDVATFVREAQNRGGKTSRTAGRLHATLGWRFRESAVGQCSAGHDHALGTASDLAVVIYFLQVDATGDPDLRGRADRRLWRNTRPGSARDAIQHLGRSRVHRALWGRRPQRLGVGQRSRGLAGDGGGRAGRGVRDCHHAHSTRADDRVSGQSGVFADGDLQQRRSGNSTPAGHRRDRRTRHLHPAYCPGGPCRLSLVRAPYSGTGRIRCRQC